MLKELFGAIKDFLKEYTSHRLFPLTVVFLVLFGILIQRLFVLQIVDGQEYLYNFTYKQERTVTVPASRGIIYDCNGKELAYNEISYSVIFGNSPQLSTRAEELDMTEDELKNKLVYDTIQILEGNGDAVLYDSFPIELDASGTCQFTVSGNALTRFRMEVYAVSRESDLKEHANASAEEIFQYLRNNHNARRNRNFNIADSYSKADALKIMAVRYSLWLNRFQQYVTVKIALNVSEASVAQITENKYDLPGMDVQVDSTRIYNDSKYFANIIGYIGSISSDEMAEYNNSLPEDSQYTSADVVGKMGIENVLEAELRGKGGNQHLFVDNMGRVLEVIDSSDAVAGNDVYLSIDSDLQKYCYDALERELAGILLAHLDEGNTRGTEKNILIPINDAYFALFRNNTLTMEHIRSEQASDNERSFLSTFEGRQTSVLSSVEQNLLNSNAAIKDLSEEDQDYMNYIYRMLMNQEILDVTVIPDNDEKFLAFNQNQTISLGEYLRYAINQNAINISNFELNSDYYDSEEIYSALVENIITELQQDNEFDKLIIQYMIESGVVSGRQVCLMLYDQGKLSTEDEDYSLLQSGQISAYTFMYRKIQKIELTPAQLALDPCSGSVVVTDVNTGKVLALVSYPSYDNNRLTNTIEAEYYMQLDSDITSPMFNRATQQRTAPGSTYKMLSTVAGVQEGVLGLNETIETKGEFDLVPKNPHCWIYPGTHGTIGIIEALEVSCNYFYYDVGYRLGLDSAGVYREQQGLDQLAKYAGVFGLDRKSGIELPEAEPSVSKEDAPRSAIGQGTNSYTPIQLARYVNTVATRGECYDLSIVNDIRNFEGESVYQAEPNVTAHPEISSALWNSIHQGMRQVITDNTSASSLLNQMDVAVAGKTGTAQEDLTRGSHGLFVSFAPYNNPEITVTTVIPYGYSSGNAEELASFVYAYYYQPELLENSQVSGSSVHTD
ncbi:MAG: penicillin-binding transpeptidase domain-containing protein [Bacteroides sp.]|nr:penicillin-binding transpeptidase domain-containing protein [Bacteroides sp.]MCM1549354.1 penicillin-binding transpeptidase domain-containing protein [Clostridium sp.]